MEHGGSVQFERGGGEAWRNPFPMYRELRDHAPLVEIRDGDYWVLSRWNDVFDALIDTATFSSAKGLTTDYRDMEELGLESPIVMMDPPDHTAVRKLGVKQFTPRRVREIEAMVRDFVVERVERLREAGEGDIVAELFKPLPSRVVAHFLGVPDEVRDHFDGWTESTVSANAGGDILKDGAGAVAEMFRLFAGLIEERRKEPREDLFSALVHARIDGEPVSMARILGFGFTMVTGGNDTVTGLLGGASQLLSEHPEAKAHLAAEPEAIPRAIEECLRLVSPLQALARTTTREVSLHGQTIPAGKRVLLLYGSANRDQREFGPEAEVFEPDRKIRRHVALGYGSHHCIGAAAARLQARVVLEELLARCPDFQVDAEKGRFAPGAHVRRYESLPFRADG